MKYRRRAKFYLLKLFRLHDSPKAVAGGIAWGTFVHFYPTFGFGALFAVGLARLFRSNMIAATLAWGITMPLFPLLFYLNFKTGDFLLGKHMTHLHMAVQGMAHLRFKDLVLAGEVFFLGSFINGVIGLLLIWWIGYLLFKRYRKNTLNWIKRVL